MTNSGSSRWCAASRRSASGAGHGVDVPQTAARQGLRPCRPAQVPARPGHRHADRPPRCRTLGSPWPTPLGGRAHDVVTERLPPPAPPLRKQTRALPGLRRHRRHPHLQPSPRQSRRRLNPATTASTTPSTGRTGEAGTEHGSAGTTSGPASAAHSNTHIRSSSNEMLLPYQRWPRVGMVLCPATPTELMVYREARYSRRVNGGRPANSSIVSVTRKSSWPDPMAANIVHRWVRCSTVTSSR